MHFKSLWNSTDILRYFLLESNFKAYNNLFYKILLIIFICLINIDGEELYKNPEKYTIINKKDWILGVVKLDINFNNGAFGSIFGFFIDEDTIITSSDITNLGFPLDINIKMKDDDVDLIICIAKARLLANDTNKSLAMLKITNYTDDYCNYSDKKLYHQEIIKSQKIQIPNHKKTAKRKIVDSTSLFFYKNYMQTIATKQGMPYFDRDYNLIGISSNNEIIKIDEIVSFINNIKSKDIK